MTISESPVQAEIVSRFDLGFILKHPNGQTGELRVPEMSSITKEFDSSINITSGIGENVDVYIVHELNGGYLFSEYSRTGREERDLLKKQRLKAQEEAEIGRVLPVNIEHKLPWGCICRDLDGLMEGVILAQSSLKEKQWQEPELQISENIWNSLSVGSQVNVIISKKEWSHWRYIVYLSLITK